MASYPQYEQGDPGGRLPAREAATAFIERHFPDCAVAFLTGSVVQGQVTATSDLDIVVITAGTEEPRWATFHAFGWPIEVWVQTGETYRDAFAHDAKQRWPLLPILCRDGVVLRDNEAMAARIQREAREILEQGPPPLTEEEVGGYRYTLTWMLEDLEGCADPAEALLMAGYLAHSTAGFLLAYYGRWHGRGKWLLRDLRQLDPALADQLSEALETLGRTACKEDLIQFTEAALRLVGGRRFEGQEQRGLWSD
jgi:hypothetical protein